MSHIFTIGKEYPREDLLAFVGSKQTQVGIIWGSKVTCCVICTAGGRHSQKAGYRDQQNHDGSWDYFGQGQVGHQNPENYGNKLLINGEKSILLFSTHEPTSKEIQTRKHLSMEHPYSKRYSFEGSYNVGSWDFIVPKQGKRKGDKLLKFHLYPESNVDDEQISPSLYQTGNSLLELRAQALKKKGMPCKGKVSSTEYKKASASIKHYARIRANGICEKCNKKAPFTGIDGMPFLEVHHLLRLADDGPDSPFNVAAICPNCHRGAHYSIERDRICEILIDVIHKKELEIANCNK